MDDDDAVARRRDVGRRVALWRKRRGLTRTAFADLCGRSPSWVDKVERGERALDRLPMVERVATVLQVPVEALLGTASGNADVGCLDLVSLASIREALQRYAAITTLLRPTSDGEPPDACAVRRQVEYAWTAFQNGHYSGLGRVLPGMLLAAQDLASTSSGDTRRETDALLSQAYQVTASALWKMREVDLAWLAAERGMVLAERTGDALLISDAARRVAQGLMVTGHGDQALDLLRADIDRLEPGPGQAGPAYLSLYGMLFLLGGVVAARLGRAGLVAELHGEGERVAARLGADGNERWTAFGPTNVALHQVAAFVDLGEGGAAVRVAAAVTTEGLQRLPRERRAAFFVDVARGHALDRHRDTAVAALLQAERLAPDEVRCRPIAVTLIDELLRLGTGPAPLPLRQLAARVGLGPR